MRVMNFSTVVCLDDLARETFWPAKEFIYDLVRLPIHLAAGIDIAKSPRDGQRSNLRPGFDAARFLALARGDARTLRWSDCHFGIRPFAADYLCAHLPADALVLSYEMPPWLRSVLDLAGVAWLDVRVAPLRFGSDLYLGLATNRPELYAAIHQRALREHDVMADAGLLAAKVRYRLRYRSDSLRLAGSTVYIGQTGEDASLLTGPGHYLRAADAAPALAAFVGTTPVLYKPHPYAGEFAQAERHALQQMFGRPLELCDTDTYDLIAGDAPVRLVGISSGALQEAAWFGQDVLHAVASVVRADLRCSARRGAASARRRARLSQRTAVGSAARRRGATGTALPAGPAEPAARAAQHLVVVFDDDDPRQHLLQGAVRDPRCRRPRRARGVSRRAGRGTRGHRGIAPRHGRTEAGRCARDLSRGAECADIRVLLPSDRQPCAAFDRSGVVARKALVPAFRERITAPFETRRGRSVSG